MRLQRAPRARGGGGSGRTTARLSRASCSTGGASPIAAMRPGLTGSHQRGGEQPHAATREGLRDRANKGGADGGDPSRREVSQAVSAFGEATAQRARVCRRSCGMLARSRTYHVRCVLGRAGALRKTGRHHGRIQQRLPPPASWPGAGEVLRNGVMVRPTVAQRHGWRGDGGRGEASPSRAVALGRPKRLTHGAPWPVPGRADAAREPGCDPHPKLPRVCLL